MNARVHIAAFTTLTITVLTITSSFAAPDIDALIQTSGAAINEQITCQESGACAHDSHFLITDDGDFEELLGRYLLQEIKSQESRIEDDWPADADACAKDAYLSQLKTARQVAENFRPGQYEDQWFSVAKQARVVQGIRESRWMLFEDSPDSIQLALTDPTTAAGECQMQDEPAIALVTELAVRINAYLARFNKPTLMEQAQDLRLLADQWRWFVTSGYSQFPWEYMVNSKLLGSGKSIWDLPSWQLVLAHPSIAYEYDDNETGHAAMVFELVGFTKYLYGSDTGSNHFWGLSSIYRLREDRPGNFGLMANWDGIGLGATYGFNAGPKEWGILLTADLYSLIQPGRPGEEDAATAKAKQVAKKAALESQ